MNSNHKDRLFTFIFGREENKKWTLELYNAINGTDYSNEDDIEINTIDDVLYMGMKNDVSFLLGSFLSLYEQQSTYNPNMPVRDLMYLGKLYDKYIHGHRLNIYGKHRIKLPVPKLVTFYNGTEQHEDGILKLTDSFDEEYRMHSDVEVRVRMININPGHNEELVKTCRPLFEYSWLIDSIRNNRQKMEIKEAVDKALRDMPGDFVIREFVELNRAEVTNMCLTEYNEAETMEMLKEEAREEGRSEGIEEGRLEGIKEGRLEGIKEGRSEGIKEGMSQTADDVLRAISGGATVEDIQKMLTKEKSGTAKK